MSLDIVVIPAPAIGDDELPNAHMSVLLGASNDYLEGMQQVVGGSVQFLDDMTGEGDFAMVVHEDGKYDPACRPNIRATDLMRGRYLGVDDYICGTVFLMHVDPTPEGNARGITKESVQYLLRGGFPIDGAVRWLTGE